MLFESEAVKLECQSWVLNSAFDTFCFFPRQITILINLERPWVLAIHRDLRELIIER